MECAPYLFVFNISLQKADGHGVLKMQWLVWNVYYASYISFRNWGFWRIVYRYRWVVVLGAGNDFGHASMAVKPLCFIYWNCFLLLEWFV
jgi:hypothetical protein